jgi:hypothetical protein
MNNHIYTVQFRIYGNTLNPSEVTADTKLTPCASSISKARATGQETKSMWAYDGSDDVLFPGSEWDNLESGILFLLKKLQPVQEKIILHSAKNEGVWWCGHFQKSFDGGPKLSVEVLRKLSEFGFPVYIDNYFEDVKPAD